MLYVRLKWHILARENIVTPSLGLSPTGDAMFKASEVLAAQYTGADLGRLQQAITANYSVDEDAYLRELLPLVPQEKATLDSVTEAATQLVQQVRDRADNSGIDAFLQEYSLDTKEGIILMCLAEDRKSTRLNSSHVRISY